MRGKRLVPVLVAAVGFLAAFVDPVAAQQYQSVTEELIRNLNSMLLAAALPVTLLVEGILVYTVWKFRNSDEAKPTKENRRLEITWTVATAVVLLFVGVAAYGVMAQPSVTATQADAQEAMAEDDTVVVDSVGVQWYWNYEYPEENLTVSSGAATGDVDVGNQPMVVPEDTKLVIRTKSTDVIHAFHAPEIGLKADAVPGQTNYLITEVNEKGTYQLYCAEFCGQGHSEMLGTIAVVEEDTYQEWVEDPENTTIDV
ncbi:cytochrome c oxidase subunit II [Halobacterium sp. KA-4]|jgi:cytochrome c oxidase subunit 2|uniref:cytochrome c oxidase subunit II n=1 Tax=Halobacterium sp. KA-4 TaxID=2896367 RepID=UPI001E6486D8|nr:cytochrome c oxidase subunit II [Halobacterium sp. KA-4]MCD2198334.1 cytochrome c oxidase subunit II [Halobacterium sp. KA-4]